MTEETRYRLHFPPLSEPVVKKPRITERYFCWPVVQDALVLALWALAAFTFVGALWITGWWLAGAVPPGLKVDALDPKGLPGMYGFSVLVVLVALLLRGGR